MGKAMTVKEAFESLKKLYKETNGFDPEELNPRTDWRQRRVDINTALTTLYVKVLGLPPPKAKRSSHF